MAAGSCEGGGGVAFKDVGAAVCATWLDVAVCAGWRGCGAGGGGAG